jgi:hypothetical protein
MNRSTGGLVLLERTSVKDGRRFLREVAQSSCWRFSSSMVAEWEGGGEERIGCFDVGQQFANACGFNNQPVTRFCHVSHPSSAFTPIIRFRHGLHESILPGSQGAQVPLFADGKALRGCQVCLLSNSADYNSYVHLGSLSCRGIPPSKNSTQTCPY